MLYGQKPGSFGEGAEKYSGEQGEIVKMGTRVERCSEEREIVWAMKN